MADIFSSLVGYQNGTLSETELLNMLRVFADKGLVTRLQGPLGHKAQKLITEGLLSVEMDQNEPAIRSDLKAAS